MKKLASSRIEEKREMTENKRSRCDSDDAKMSLVVRKNEKVCAVFIQKASLEQFSSSARLGNKICKKKRKKERKIEIEKERGKKIYHERIKSLIPYHLRWIKT